MRKAWGAIFAYSLGLWAFIAPMRASNMTLSQPCIDSAGGILDFSLANIGVAPNQVANTIGPGDTIFIVGQTQKKLIFKNLIQGTTASPVTISNSGGQVIVNGLVTDYDAQGLNFYGCQHVILKGIPALPTYAYGFHISQTKTGNTGIRIGDNDNLANLIGSLDIEITNLEIDHTGFSGIQAKCQNTMPVGYVMDNLRIHDNYIHDTGGEGMYIGWTDPGHHRQDHVQIYHNQVSNAGWTGIQVSVSSNTVVHDNTIIGYGITSYSGAEPFSDHNKGFSFGATQAQVYNNWVEATADYAGNGMVFYTYANSGIYNNVFYYGTHNNEDPTKPTAAIFVGDVSGSLPPPGTVINFINNTIVSPDGSGIKDGSTGATVNFINNIVAAPGKSQPYVNRSVTGTTLNEITNLYVATVTGAGFTNAAGFDFTLTSSSAALDIGTNESSNGVTTDFVGTSRPQGLAYDAGAYERVAMGHTTVIITPAAWGQCTGSNFCSASGAFNAQPTWDAVNLKPVGDDPVPYSDTNTTFANCFWFIDFGPNFAKVHITQMWTRYRPYSGGSYTGYAAFTWNPNTDTVLTDGTAAPTLNFQTATSLPDVSIQQWVKDRDFTSAPVTPLYRYLIISTGANPPGRANEYTFVGWVDP